MRAVSDDRPCISALPSLRENAELRRRLACAQAALAKVVGEAGDLRAQIAALQADLAVARADRDTWRAEAERLVGWGVVTAGFAAAPARPTQGRGNHT